MHRSSCTARLQLQRSAGLVQSSGWYVLVMFSNYCMWRFSTRGGVRRQVDDQHSTKTIHTAKDCWKYWWQRWLGYRQSWSVLSVPSKLYSVWCRWIEEINFNVRLLGAVGHIVQDDRGKRRINCLSSRVHLATPSGKVLTFDRVSKEWTANHQMTSGS